MKKFMIFVVMALMAFLGMVSPVEAAWHRLGQFNIGNGVVATIVIEDTNCVRNGNRIDGGFMMTSYDKMDNGGNRTNMGYTICSLSYDTDQQIINTYNTVSYGPHGKIVARSPKWKFDSELAVDDTPGSPAGSIAAVLLNAVGESAQ